MNDEFLFYNNSFFMQLLANSLTYTINKIHYKKKKK